jgi:hypothetical protein
MIDTHVFPDELSIDIADFIARFDELIEQLAADRLSRVVVVRDGQALSVLTAPPKSTNRGSRHGAMAGRIQRSSPAFDFTGPVLETDSNAELGIIVADPLRYIDD